MNGEPVGVRDLFHRICSVSVGTPFPQLVWQQRTPNRSSHFTPWRVVIDAEDLAEVAQESGAPLGAVYEWAMAHEVGHARQHERGEPMSELGADRWAEHVCDRLGWNKSLHARVFATVERRRGQRRAQGIVAGFEWLPEPTGTLSGFQWLGSLEADASGTELAQPTNGTKRSLSVIEKVVIAGFFVNLFGIGWNVYRGMKQDEAAEKAKRAA